MVESQSFREAKQAGRHHHMNLNGIDAGFEAGQLTLSARLGGGAAHTAAAGAATRVTTYSYKCAGATPLALQRLCKVF